MLEERIGLGGRVVVVAGAGGGGIGTAVCRLVAEARGAVIAVDAEPEHLAVAEQAMADAGGRSVSLVADVLDVEGFESAVAEGTEALGPVHGLVHVVGGLAADRWGSLVDTPQTTVDEILRLNLNSAFITSRIVATRLIEQSTGGSIVHIASIAGFAAMPYGAAYGAAKAGLMALTRTAAVEWGRFGVRVNAVAPGTVRTARATSVSGPEDQEEGHSVIPLGRRGTPDDVAGAALFLLSDLAGFVSGQVLAVDGGSSVRPSYLDEDDLPVFVRDQDLRDRLKS